MIGSVGLTRLSPRLYSKTRPARSSSDSRKVRNRFRVAKNPPIDLFAGRRLVSEHIFNAYKRANKFQSNMWLSEKDIMECIAHELIPVDSLPLKSGVDGLAIFENRSHSARAKLYYNLEETTCTSSFLEYINERAPLCCVTGRRFSFANQVLLINHARSLNLDDRHWISQEALHAFFNRLVVIHDGAIPVTLKLGRKEQCLQEEKTTRRNTSDLSKHHVPFFNSQQTSDPVLAKSRVNKPLMKNYSTGKTFPLSAQHTLFVFAEKKGFHSSLWVDEETIEKLEESGRRIMLLIKPEQTALRLRVGDSPREMKYYNVDQLTDSNLFYENFRLKVE